MKETYKTINNKQYHVVYIPIRYNITQVFNYENNGYTVYKVYNNYVILYKEV